jgi:hypothetical protein
MSIAITAFPVPDKIQPFSIDLSPYSIPFLVRVTSVILVSLLSQELALYYWLDAIWPLIFYTK